MNEHKTINRLNNADILPVLRVQLWLVMKANHILPPRFLRDLSHSGLLVI
jgi:hypothetical protein